MPNPKIEGRKEGFNAFQEEHDANLAAMDWMAKNNPKAVLAWIEGNLLNGKFLILPSSIYSECISLCRENGIAEEAIKNIYESKSLPANLK